MKLLSVLFTSLFVTIAHSQQAEIVNAASNTYIIQLNHQSLVHYDGGYESFDATSPSATGTRKLDTKSEAAQAYLQFLRDELSNTVDQIQTTLGRSVNTKFEYYYANYGMAMNLTADEASLILSIGGVVSVVKEKIYELDTDVGPTFIGANTIWDGTSVPGNIPNQGEGMIVGVLDTGINMDHPSFSDSPEDLYDFAAANPLGAGNTVAGSDCSPTNVCNNKLIGVWDFADGPDDTNGHGSHTASTVAGNRITAGSIPGGFVTTTGTPLAAPSISGVAPHAHIIAYDVY